MKKMLLNAAILGAFIEFASATTDIKNEDNSTNMTQQCVKKGSGRGARVRYKQCLRKQKQNINLNQGIKNETHTEILTKDYQ